MYERLLALLCGCSLCSCRALDACGYCAGYSRSQCGELSVYKDPPGEYCILMPAYIRKSIEDNYLKKTKARRASHHWRSAESGCTLDGHSTRANVMDDVLKRLGEALAGRCTIEREIGRGGMSVVLPIRPFNGLHVLHERKVNRKLPQRREMRCTQSVGILRQPRKSGHSQEIRITSTMSVE